MSISDKITSIENHLSADYEGLENIGADLTGINKNILNIRTILDTIYNDLPKVTGEGTEVTLTPTRKGRLALIPKGNSIQEGEPTPSTPIPIKNVTGNNNVVVHSANLFNRTNASEHTSLTWTTGLETSSTSTANNIVSPYIQINNYTNIATNYNAWFFFYDKNYNYLGQNTNLSKASGGTYKTTIAIPYSIDNSIYYVRVQIRGIDNGDVDMNTKQDIVVNNGTTAIDYVPYQNQTLPLNLGTIELNKIGNYQDYIYKNNGNWYKHEEIEKVVFDGSEDESWTAVGSYQRYRIPINSFISPDADVVADILCNRLRCVSKNQVAFYDNVIGGGEVDSSYFFLRINSQITTSQELRTFLAEHPLTVEYGLSTSTDIEITDTSLIEQLEEINKMLGYNGTTIITSTYDSNNAQMIISASALKGEE